MNVKNIVDPDEEAHNGLPHLDLHCLPSKHFFNLQTVCQLVFRHLKSYNSISSSEVSILSSNYLSVIIILGSLNDQSKEAELASECYAEKNSGVYLTTSPPTNATYGFPADLKYC